MAQINNIRTVSVPSLGKLPLAAEPGSFTPSGKNRAHKPGRLAEDGGHTESAVPAKLDLNINLLAGVDFIAMNDIAGEDITVKLADGSVHLMSQAFVENPVGVDGSSKLTIFANTSERIS